MRQPRRRAGARLAIPSSKPAAVARAAPHVALAAMRAITHVVGKPIGSSRTGSAVWGVRLAQRGWDVTGIDIVEKALRRARARADQASAEVRLVHADVTALREAGLGSSFRLLLDTGTFHGLSDAQREAMGRELSAVAAPDATLILDCFAPRRRGPLPSGASRANIERAFPGWEITDVEVADTEPDALARLMKFDERFYRLRRTVEQPQRASTDQDDAEELEAIARFESDAADRQNESSRTTPLR